MNCNPKETLCLHNLPIEMYFVTAVGAFILYLVIQSRGQKTLQIISYFKPELMKNPFIRMAEAFLFAFMGGYIATIIFGPINAQQALGAGFGWTSLLFGFSGLQNER